MIEDRDIDKQVEQEIRRRIAEDPRHVILAYQTEIERLERENEHLASKADFFDIVTMSEDWMEMAAAVKLLGFPGWGRNKTFSFLRDRNILRHNNEPYQSYVERGYFKSVEQHFDNPSTGETMINRKTVVSQKGLDFIRKILAEE